MAFLSMLALMFHTPVGIADEQIAKTYGLGLLRDLDILSIPDADYPDWPLTKSQAAYADVSGKRMKDWVGNISAVSLRSKKDDNMYWGRLPGTEYDRETM